MITQGVGHLFNFNARGNRAVKNRLGIRKTLTGLLLTAVFLTIPNVSLARVPEAWPDGWENMAEDRIPIEIEAKWETTDPSVPICNGSGVPNPNATINKIIAAFPDGRKYTSPGGTTYFLNVRWKNGSGEGISRKFVDLYYDNNERELSNGLHLLRHRKRFAQRPRPANNCPESFNSGSGLRFDWERVQYKSTPFRFTPVWFRPESGNDCNVSHRDNEELCDERSVPDILTGNLPSHGAINDQEGLLKDHPGFYDRSTIDPAAPFLEVSQFRYRVEMCPGQPCNGGNVVYELSLDQVETTSLPSGSTTFSVEVELEIDKSPRNVSEVLELFAIADDIQDQFGLIPSTTSKGGLLVPEPLVVTKFTDTKDGTCNQDCSLREAIIAANTMTGLDIISVPAGTYGLTISGRGEDAGASGDLDITDHLVIAGAGGAATTIIDGGGQDRVFHVLGLNNVGFTGLTIQNGMADVGGGFDVRNGSNATFDRCIFFDNRAESGGALHVMNSSVYINNCTFRNNSAGRGAGITISNGTLAIKNSTVQDGTVEGIATDEDSTEITVDIINSTIATNERPGVFLEDGGGTVRITNSTISGNGSNSLVDGGGISTSPNMVTTVQNSVVAGNIAEVRPDCDDLGPITSLGNNIFGDPEGCDTLLPTDLTGDPGLGAFIDPGIPGQGRYPLVATSPAIDMGNNDACPPTDQLGQARVDGDNNGSANCDIGAIEFIPVVNNLVALDNVSTSCCPAFTITATFTNTSSTPIQSPVFQVVELSGGNVLNNAKGGAGGVGAQLTPDVGDRVFSPGESVTVDFVIGLQALTPFTFFVDLLGVPSL